MIYELIYNPVFLIFTSYGLGILVTEVVKLFGGYHYFKNHNYISDQWTRRLGVLHFGWLIRHSFMGKFNTKLKYTGKAKQDTLEELKRDMTYAENNHLFAFFLLLPINFSMLFHPIPLWYIIFFFILNGVFNLYLVFLQQYNKRRIDRLLRSNN